jgi:predicted transcriptional regulator of viral defense system
MRTATGTKNVRAGLTGRESRLLSSLAEAKKNVFTIRDVMSELGCSYEHAKVIANSLVRKKWSIPITRGKYLIVPLSAGKKSLYTEHEFVIASHLAYPYYIAYWSALNHHRFTEQVPMTVFIATTKRLRGRTILGNRFKFVTISKRKFFGFEKARIGDSLVNVASKEKSLADALDHPEYCGGIAEVAKCLENAKGQVSFEKVVDHASKMGNEAILKRLGYLLETLDIKRDPDFLGRVRKRMSKGISALDRSAVRKGTYNTRWNLLVNIPAARLVSWKAT